MSQPRTLYIAALNIAMADHQNQSYQKLLESIRRNRLFVRYHGDRGAMLTSVIQPDNLGSGEILVGTVSTFLNVDPNDNWLNTETGRPAEDDDIRELVLPEHLKPGRKTFNFLFYAEYHRLFFTTRSPEGWLVSPQSMRKIFERFFLNPDVEERFGPIEVTAEPQTDALERIFSINQLKRLSISLVPPNADDHDEEEERLLRRLRDQNAREHNEELVAEKGKSLNPDDETRTTARVAKSNGYVEAKGRDENNDPDSYSTKEHPMIERAEYDPDTETISAAIWSKALLMMEAILKR